MNVGKTKKLLETFPQKKLKDFLLRLIINCNKTKKNENFQKYVAKALKGVKLRLDYLKKLHFLYFLKSYLR